MYLCIYIRQNNTTAKKVEDIKKIFKKRKTYKKRQST